MHRHVCACASCGCGLHVWRCTGCTASWMRGTSRWLPAWRPRSSRRHWWRASRPANRKRCAGSGAAATTIGTDNSHNTTQHRQQPQGTGCSACGCLPAAFAALALPARPGCRGLACSRPATPHRSRALLALPALPQVSEFFRQHGAALLVGSDAAMWRQWAALAFLAQPRKDPAFQVPCLACLGVRGRGTARAEAFGTCHVTPRHAWRGTAWAGAFPGVPRPFAKDASAGLATQGLRHARCMHASHACTVWHARTHARTRGTHGGRRLRSLRQQCPSHVAWRWRPADEALRACGARSCT